MRTFVAFLAAPLVVALGWSLSVLLSESIENPSELVVTTAVVYIAAVWVTVLLALPLFVLLRRFDLVRSWTSVVVGLAVGGVGATIYSDFVDGAWGIGLGGLAGLVFWSIWRPRSARPRFVENLVLAHTASHWQNSFRIVSLVLRDAESRRVIVEAEAVAEQVRKLAMEGRLESRGDLRVLQSSEIRHRS